MQKNFSHISLLTLILLWATTATGITATLDAPHNAAYNIKCSTCHTYSTWWQYSPAPNNDPTFATATNTTCLSCHNGSSSNAKPVMLAHNSTNLGTTHGIWSTNCIDCHDPHFQAQLDWLGTYSNQIYLTTGAMVTIANGDGTSHYSYTDNGNGTTSIDIDPAATNSAPAWNDPTTWSKKNNNTSMDRGLLFVHGTTKAYNTYQVTAATNNQITVKGSFDGDAADASLDQSFGLIYGQLLRSSIMAGTVGNPLTIAEKNVTFFDPNMGSSLGGFTDTETPRQGVCQVCHINTIYWTEDGNRDGHHSSETCTNCHLITEGFNPNGGHTDGDGTLSWDATCAVCHQPQGNETILTDVHKIGTKNSCTLCHVSESGGAIDLNTSAANAVIGSTPHLCTECHIDSNSQHHAIAESQAGDCTWCHADPRQQWEIYFSVTGSKPRQLACRECHIKADGNGLVVYKLDFPVTPDDTITFTDNDLSQEPDNSKTVIKTIMDGSNGTTNHSISGPAKIDIYDFGVCLSCHDGITATKVNVWHARPKYSEIPTDSSTDAYRMHFDTLRHAPGRSKFNLWRGDGYQGEPYFSHENEFYDDGNNDAATRGGDFFDTQNGYYHIEWNWGSTTDSFSMSPIPCFRNAGQGNDTEGLCGDNSAAASELVPVFENGPIRDSISIYRANYSNSTLSIEAANTNGNLSITYDGVDYGPMNGSSGSNWSNDIALSPLTANSVDIITTNPLGTSVLNYPICQDPITITSAKWDPVNGNTLKVEAQNIVGAPASLDVTYNGSAYPMQNLGGNQWQLNQPSVGYHPTVTISNACDTVSSSVTDLTDTIIITRAEWDPANIGTELLVWAENTSSPATLLVDYGSNLNAPMTWNEAAMRWEANLPAPEYSLSVRVHSNYFGDDSLSVVSLGEQIIFAEAQSDSTSNTLSIQAINEQGNTVAVYADYNGITYPMTHVGANRWQITGQAVSAYVDNVTIWSTGGGIINVLVNECSAQIWPPASTGTLLNAGAYWNQTDYDPARLYVSVNLGANGGMPKMIINGSGSSLEVLCSPGQLAGVYQCEINDNTLTTAGYDNWLVIYTGAFPGDSSVLNYYITDWAEDQNNIQPTTIAGNGLPTCTAQTWDIISSSSAFWDGTDLIVSATNDWQNSSQVKADYSSVSYDLNWDNTLNLWQNTISSVPFSPTTIITSEAGGYLNTNVKNISVDPDNITITHAGWNAGDSGELNVTAQNTFLNLVTLSAQYNGTSSPMTWTGSNWELQNITGVTLPADITITSSATGGGSATISPVPDLSPGTNIPACDAGNGMDQIILPLNKSRFDPSGGDELHIDVNNVVNLSYGAQFFMTYSETAASQTVYPMPWAKNFEFQYKEVGLTWSPGATVSIWSKNDQGEIMDMVCDQPVFNRDMVDTITVNKAEWEPTTNTLTIRATNSANNTTQLYLDYNAIFAKPMTWDSATNSWQIELSGVNYFNTIRVYSDANGDTTANVLDLYPDTITMSEAYWKTDISQGNLYVRANNAQGQINQLYADYSGQNSMAMTWDIEGGFWKLLVSQVDYAPNVRIWSQRPGELIGNVSDLSASHLNVSADSQCLACHPNTDIIFTIHLAKCDSCHTSPKPAVQDAIATGQGGSCVTCHQTINTRVRLTEVSFNFPGSNAITLKDHNRPNSDILVPVPEYVLDTRNEPAAYAKDSAITIQATFTADPTISSAMIGSPLFASQLVNFSAGVSAPVSFNLPASVTQTVGVLPLTIDWSYCDENSTNFPDCSTPQHMHDSHHQLYITHSAPTAAAPFFSKLVEYSTRWSAAALSEQAIVDNIFDGIWTLGAFGYKYQYPFLARTGTRVGDILRYQAGACGEWAAFMQRAVEVQGVNAHVVDIVPDQLDDMVIITESIGNGQETYLFGDHAFLVYGVPYIQSAAPTLGTAYDPSFHNTGPGWGGYEDVIIQYLEEKDVWYPNPGFGNGQGDDILDTKIREVIDDFVVDESTL